MGDELIHHFRRARRDRGLVVIEGFHALKHALRFGADVEQAYATDPGALEALAAELAPDLAGRFAATVEPIDAATLDRLAPLTPRTGVVAVARRPAVDVGAVLADERPAPVVLLEDPRNMGNIGASIRVAAGADAAALLTTGEHDPWHADAVRGAAGLQFALPVASLDSLPRGERPLLALDPEGEPLDPARLPPRAILAFGTERDGLSDSLLGAADARVSIPMREGVSSLNLATSISAVLFAWRLRGE
ncbi:MAG: TrmH family RNA methyltransferase [Solirubrobacterales bacterium]